MSKSILIIEDDHDILSALGELLTAEGYRVFTAENGQNALDLLNQSDSLPDLVLLDLMMPVMDGFQFCRIVINDEKLKNVPLVAMSADGYLREKIIKIRQTDFLTKPLELETILNTISKYI